MSGPVTGLPPGGLVLASTSPYRREMLGRLGLPFTTARPDADETPLPDEPPEALVRRLAEAKARSVAADHPQALVIGSDQVAVEPFTVHFRDLDQARIDRYLEREQPYDCAGSFKSEGLGIAPRRRAHRPLPGTRTTL
jgi:predicted house-cleaning NTP pyrophosphatase (Maf/HAM1 superfamily)